ncbi:MAG: hypothetical protein HKN47_04510 [Pirellulaceae bacterium]|nr:hypothetical protein [Pirellulaceae bacterium]
MRWLLRLSGVARQRFSRLPHWLQDIYGLVSYINFIELIPTVASIAIAPRHFFRRLPQTLAGHRSHYQTPVKFFVNFAALFVAIFFIRHGDMSEFVTHSEALWYLPAMIPLTPPIMIMLGIATWILYQLPRLAPNGDAFPSPNNGPFKLLLSPRTYASLIPSRFVWGLFYVSVYFLAAWQVAQVIIAVGFLGVVYLVSALGEGHEIVKAITVLLGIALAAFSIHGLVLYPYLEMLRASLRRPTRAVFETDVHEIRQSVKEFLAVPTDDPALDGHAEALHEIISDELAQLGRLMSQQDADFDLTVADLSSRLEIHRNAFQVQSLREKLQHVSADVRQPLNQLLSQLDPPISTVIRQAA